MEKKSVSPNVPEAVRDYAGRWNKVPLERKSSSRFCLQ